MTAWRSRSLLVALAVAVLAFTALAEPLRLPGAAAADRRRRRGVLPARRPEVHLDPDVVLLGLLPPLLYAAAIQTSLVDFNANRRADPAARRSAWSSSRPPGSARRARAAPGHLVAGAFAIGAVVAPPDAVAATAIGRRIGLPRRIVTILEGESLLNDATALVALRTALAATSVGRRGAACRRGLPGRRRSAALPSASSVFLVVAVRKHVTDPCSTPASRSSIPFARLHRRRGDPRLRRHRRRRRRPAAGPQGADPADRAVPHRRADELAHDRVRPREHRLPAHRPPGRLDRRGRRRRARCRRAGSRLSARAMLVAVHRAADGLGVPRPLPAGPARPRPAPAGPPWTYTFLLGWAGMRGVVTLAAAFVIPEDTPHREVLLLIAFTVVAGTLLLQGLSLPWLARRLQVPSPDPMEDALARATLLQQASKAGFKVLQELEYDDPHGVVDADQAAHRAAQLRGLGAARHTADQETPSELYARVRLAMIEAERAPGAGDPRRRARRRRGRQRRAGDARRRGVDARRRPGSRDELQDRVLPRAAYRRLVRPPRGAPVVEAEPEPSPVCSRASTTAPRGSRCGCAWTAATSAAATPRRCGTPPRTSARPPTRSCSPPSPARTGAGASSTTSRPDPGGQRPAPVERGVGASSRSGPRASRCRRHGRRDRRGGSAPVAARRAAARRWCHAAPRGAGGTLLGVRRRSGGGPACARARVRTAVTSRNAGSVPGSSVAQRLLFSRWRSASSSAGPVACREARKPRSR